MLTLWGMAETVIFDSFHKNMKMIWIAIPLYVPFLIWLKVMFCPGVSEYNFRQYVMEKRFWRNKVAKTRYKIYLGTDEDEENGASNGGGQDSKQDEAQRRADLALKMKIGRNVPKLGELDRTTYQHHRHLPNGGLNIVLDHTRRSVVKPPEILPNAILETGTAHLLPRI